MHSISLSPSTEQRKYGYLNTVKGRLFEAHLQKKVDGFHEVAMVHGNLGADGGLAKVLGWLQPPRHSNLRHLCMTTINL